MTMPHLMNCEHSGDGWCLECVAEQQKEIERLRLIVADLTMIAMENEDVYRDDNGELRFTGDGELVGKPH